MVSVDRVMFPPNVPAGMNHLLLSALAYHVLTGGSVDPILLRKVGEDDAGRFMYRITDGRHRFVAHLIAGCAGVPARVERG